MQNEKREEIQQEALVEISKHKRSTAALSMRVGKTYIGLQHIQKYHKNSTNLKVLVVAPKLAVFQGWKDDAEKFNLNYLNKHITFSTYLSLNKQSLDYDLIIFDECHSLLYSHQDWLNKYTGDILGLTGTPPKLIGSEKGNMVMNYCPVVYKYTTDEAVEAHILNDYKIIVHMMPMSTSRNLKITTRTGQFWTSEQKNYEYWSDRVDDARTPKEKQIASVMRMKAMQIYPSKDTYTKALLEKIKDKVIIFANTKEQAEKLCKHSYHSTNPDSEENLLLFKRGLINPMSCVLQLSEGTTIPQLKQAIIMHSYGNERKFRQRFGRCLGLNPEETSTVHVLCFKDSVDEKWVYDALSDLDQSKIIYKDFTHIIR